MLQFIFDTSKGETPQSTAQKRALVAQLMGSTRAPKDVGEGLNAIGDGIVANVMSGRANEAETTGRASANDTFSKIFGALTGQGSASPAAGYAGTASDAAAGLASSGDDFMSALVQSESSGNWGASNNEVGSGGRAGHYGRLQFGHARLDDARRAGVIPKDMTAQQFMASPEAQQAAEAWHFADIDSQAEKMGLTKYYGQTINGVPINQNSIRGMAHLGGIGGAQKFITSGGQYNPSDAYGTSLQAYGQKFGGIGGGQSQQANTAMAYAPQPGVASDAQATTSLPPLPPPSAQSAALSASSSAPAQAPRTQVAQSGLPPLQALMEAANNPWLSDTQKSTITGFIQQHMQQMDPMYGIQMQAAQQGLTKGELEIEAMRRKPTRETTEVNGRLVYKDNGELVADYSDPKTATVGNALIDVRTGQPIYEGAPEATSNMRDYDAYAADEIAAGRQPIGRLQYEQEVRKAGASSTTISVGDSAPGLGKLSTDYGYKLDPNTGQPVIDPTTGLPTAAAVPGSPAALEQQKISEANAANKDQAARYGNVVTEEIDRALELLEQDPTWTTGVLGQFMGNLKGSNADRMDNFINTVKANTAFDRLQAMRDASPTGGALGAVSAPELLLLESAIGSLERSDPKDLSFNLKRVQQIYNDIINGPQGAQASGAPQQSTQSQGDAGDVGTQSEGQSQMRRVQSEDQYNALTPGTPYIAPDGSYRIKS